MKLIKNLKLLFVSIITVVSLTQCQKEPVDEMLTQKQGMTSEVLYTPWDRYMYIDKTDTMYNSTTGKNVLSRYLKQYGFNGVYFYSTSSFIGSSSNYPKFSQFLKQLDDSGVVVKCITSGSSSKFQSGGTISNYNNSQTDPACKINRANLELEWWNAACTWGEWNMINQSINNGTIADNDFYEGWYKRLTVVDTIAARDQVLYSDRILLHVYQNGYPTYSYANAKSDGATAGRLDIIAKGARQANKKIDLYFIISAEKKSFGASNDFSGGVLQSNNTRANPFAYVETIAYQNIVNNMTPFQNQWINFKGFIWFTKRYCYKAVPPR